MNAELAEPQAAVVQMTSSADRDDNLRRAATLLGEAARRGARLAVLPENFALMGVHERDKLAIAEPDGGGADGGPIQTFLAETARRLRLWIVAGTVPIVADTEHVYGACLVYDDAGERRARYDKIHLFDVEVSRGTESAGPRSAAAETLERYRESATIAAGSPRAVCVDTPIGRLGLSVCYDLRFPELYRRLVAAGAEVLCVPSAFTAVTGRAHWHPLLKARAIENQCFVLAAAQVGVHASGRATYGHSLILDPWGEALGERGEGEGVVTATLSRARLAEIRTRFPALTHRRL